ncbi:aminoglycoside phosphotransferase family protein [Streptomyces sp. PSKA54]|uniref:Aminoglycoside phosphotransferase family protein n=1 Tax=Streptomyces himalayensis subsp. aureolus TaxID=2758039 RepID=A0A7W2D411_9ACTN|nr:aminoglycoside phosphotransferase family protein [Streptomyces himalayensis]MBA4864335.1 aminoglycoside phosphotransferase family protein [Streptomyces himalayensis subsp. aureolus]
MAETADDVVPLRGGRITPGVVRIGDTVRRPASAASPFVAAVLGLLERRGFTGAPRYLGRDQTGRDMFSYVPGWVPDKLRPWTDAQVAAAGALARAMHEATRGSGLVGRHQVVCHHDLGPNNAVFQDGMPVAFIDFDMAAPGSPLEDVGYMAWLWCVSSKAEAPPVDGQAAQVRVLTDAYGLAGPERDQLVDAMLERQARNVRFWAEVQAGAGPVEATREQIADRIAWSRREHAHTVEHRQVFEAALR